VAVAAAARPPVAAGAVCASILSSLSSAKERKKEIQADGYPCLAAFSSRLFLSATKLLVG